MAALTLTVLGAGPAGPNPGGANSGYLLRQDDRAVLIDCGAGIAGRIPLHVAVNRLNGVAISHLHPDHYFDLVALYYMLKYGEPRPVDLLRLLPVFVPPGGREFLNRFGELIANRSAMFDDMPNWIIAAFTCSSGAWMYRRSGFPMALPMIWPTSE